MRSAPLAIASALLSLAVAGAGEAVKWTPRSGRPPAPGDEYEHPVDGSILVWIPGGTFEMGRNGADPDEAPRHQVQVQGFWMGKHEVTNRQYRRFIQAGRHRTPGYWDDPDYNADDKPVVAVIWSEAFAYCGWAKLRLPTEAEWEYVASGGKDFEYPTATGALSHDLANYAGADGRDTWEDLPAPVGSFPPNPFGLYDLAGNAWEWTSTLYKGYPYSAADGREEQRPYGTRVMRGGCWHFGSRYCTTTHRHRFASHLRLDYVGFRVAASPSYLGAGPEPPGRGDR